MILFGITLFQFSKLLTKGESHKPNLYVRLLLARKSNKRFKTKNLDNLTVGEISSLEIYLEQHNYLEFCRIFVCKKWYEAICIQHWPLILQDYIEQKTKCDEEWKEIYYYVFNPPQYGMPGEETQGSILRQDFVNEFGNWVVLTDLILSKQPLGYKEIEKWNIIDFLFWANYYSGQQIIEKVK